MPHENFSKHRLLPKLMRADLYCACRSKLKAHSQGRSAASNDQYCSWLVAVLVKRCASCSCHQMYFAMPSISIFIAFPFYRTVTTLVGHKHSGPSSNSKMIKLSIWCAESGCCIAADPMLGVEHETGPDSFWQTFLGILTEQPNRSGVVKPLASSPGYPIAGGYAPLAPSSS